MESYEQIAQAMLRAWVKEQGLNIKDWKWEKLSPRMQFSWIAAAKAAHKEITEVH